MAHSYLVLAALFFGFMKTIAASYSGIPYDIGQRSYENNIVLVGLCDFMLNILLISVIINK